LSEDWDEEGEEDSDEEWTPEDCPMGTFSPGTEFCDFCPWYDICAAEFEKLLKKEART
jgi:hypothetical protein